MKKEGSTITNQRSTSGKEGNQREEADLRLTGWREEGGLPELCPLKLHDVRARATAPG